VTLLVSTDVDELIRWYAGQDATIAEIVAALRAAGVPRSKSTVANRAKALGVTFSRVQGTSPAPTVIGMFPHRPERITFHLAQLADLGDTRAGLTLTEYEREKARILGESCS